MSIYYKGFSNFMKIYHAIFINLARNLPHDRIKKMYFKMNIPYAEKSQNLIFFQNF